MLLKKLLAFYIFFCCTSAVFSQTATVDSNSIINTVTDAVIKKTNEQQYNIDNGKSFVYPKPKAFGFISNLPKDGAGIAIAPFKRKNLSPLLLVAGSTALLSMVDESVAQGVHQFSKNIHLQPGEQYKDILNIKSGKTNVSLLKAPQNINTALYQMGQGFPSLLIGAGLFTFGKIHNDYRAISTASQLAESFILMGVGTQVLKRITGRQSPSEAVNLDGAWNPLPSFKNYQTHTPFYDAFPSGHLATLMSTVTVLLENYPEKKWIKPVGYSLMGMVGYAMINADEHWVSDYPLAIALGYLCAKQVAKNNRKTVQSFTGNRHKATLSYTINYVNRCVMPGVIYKF